jgi:protein-disulfide isomerase
MSKRAELREKRRRENLRRRVRTIVLIFGGAVLLVAFFVWLTYVMAGRISVPEFRERPMADGRTMGDPDAPVVVQVFEDFQCPACVSYSTQTEPLIEEAYVATGDVYYIYHHYAILDRNVPGEESHQAASASMCAADQDRFWDYHDILFANWNGENLGAFSDRRLVLFARELDLDMTTFEDCFENRTHYGLLEEDFELGIQMLVTGTPAIFVNGEQVTPGYVPSFAQLSQAIDEQLALLETE